eukprot:8436641-Pyramimonas_sp.AAC.2
MDVRARSSAPAGSAPGSPPPEAPEGCRVGSDSSGAGRSRCTVDHRATLPAPPPHAFATSRRYGACLGGLGVLRQDGIGRYRTHRGEQCEKAGNWTRGEKRGRGAMGVKRTLAVIGTGGPVT